MSDNEVNIHVLDASYEPFPTFEEWASRTSVDTVRWDRYNEALTNDAQRTPQVLERALEIAKRAAALDTGAIEGLYEVDRGFTYTVAVEASAWEAALTRKGDHVRPLFEAQLHAYNYVLDLATRAEPISEAAIRALHEEVCRAQPTYRVMTAVGPQEQALPAGQYKILPNHVRTRTGSDHSYAPVDVTPAEMARLVVELRGELFLSAHPAMQAAYAHYGLVVVHPFADGNGRVARALASAFTYRAISMPIVILSEHKNLYFDALENADLKRYQVFVDFILARSLDTIKLVDESVRSALVPSAQDSLAGITNLYITKGGYTHDQVDQAGKQLLQAITQAIIASSTNLPPKLNRNLALQGANYQIPVSTYRTPLNREGVLTVSFSTEPPAFAQAARQYFLWLPRDAAGEDDIRLMLGNTTEQFSARMEELLPSISGILQVRINMFGERIVREILSELRELAQKAFGVRS
jgi:Fic family protein